MAVPLKFLNSAGIVMKIRGGGKREGVEMGTEKRPKKVKTYLGELRGEKTPKVASICSGKAKQKRKKQQGIEHGF